MRKLAVFLLLLPLPLVSQVKILMPVVVRDAAGKPVTDLQASDFQVSGPKNASIDRMWLVPPATLSNDDSQMPVLVVYDAANVSNQYPEVTAKRLRALLSAVAQHRAPVTLLINSADGLHSIYDPATSPDVLSAALTLMDDPKATNSDPNVEEQVARLRLLSTLEPIRNFRYDHGLNQMNSLLAVAHLSGQSGRRKAVLWLTGYPAFDSRRPQYELMVEELNAARVSVYPFCGASVHDNGSLSITPLLELGESTGGLIFEANPFKGTVTLTSDWQAVQATLADFGSYYMVAVEVPTPKDTSWVRVKITLNRPGLMLRAAPGFYGLKPLKTK